MNEKTFNEDFDLEDIDSEIEKIHTRPSLIDKVSKSKDETNEKKESSSKWAEIQEHWYIYLFLAFSAVFTATLGIYLGLSPINKTDPSGAGYVHFHTDPFHVFLSLLYAASFVLVTEGAFAIGKHLYYFREDANKTQRWLMLAMMGVAGASILFTGYSGMSVIASFIEFMTAYKDVSNLAQKWIVSAIPVLVVIYAFLLTPYVLSSEDSKNKRILREQKRKSDLDHQLRQQTINNFADELLSKEELKVYIKLVREGRITAAEASAARRAGLTLARYEKQQNRDIDGDGKIGTPSGADTLAPRLSLPTPPQAPPHPPSYRAYTLDELLAAMGLTREQAVGLINQYELWDATGAFYTLKDAGYIPDDFGSDQLASGRFRGLYSELMGYKSMAIPVKAPTVGAKPDF